VFASLETCSPQQSTMPRRATLPGGPEFSIDFGHSKAVLVAVRREDFEQHVLPAVLRTF
jgi:hypothetical protein